MATEINIHQSTKEYLQDAEKRFQDHSLLIHAENEELLQAGGKRLEKKVHKGAKRVLVGAATVASAVAIVPVTGRAIDNEISSGEPPAYLKGKVDNNGMVPFTPENFDNSAK